MNPGRFTLNPSIFGKEDKKRLLGCIVDLIGREQCRVLWK